MKLRNLEMILAFCFTALIVNSTFAADYARDVLPILAHHCRKCHGSDKAEGGLRLHNRDAAMRGGDNGAVVTPGKSGTSELIARVTSEDPEHRMPPDKKPLSAKEIETLKTWIDDGFAWDVEKRARPYRMALLEVRPPPGKGHPIDRILKKYLEQRGFTPPAPISDEAFARRVYYDTIGLPPTPAELGRFLADESPDRRVQLVRRALDDHASYVGHWMTFWSDHLQVGSSVAGSVFNGDQTAAPRDWLRQKLAADRGYNYFVNDVISGGFLDLYGKSLAPPGEETSASLSAPMQSATMTAHVFLGVQLKCASCHDSFIDRWKMDHAWGLATALADSDLEIVRCNQSTGRTATPGFIFPEVGTIAANLIRPQRLRRVAQLVVDGRNGLFHRTITNRIWARLFGRGLIEPLDEMIEHDAWHPELLEWLALELRRKGYSLKEFLFVIMTSDAYRLPGVVRNDRPRNDFVFHGPEIRRLTAEQFVDTLALLAVVPGSDEQPSRLKSRAWQYNNDSLMAALSRPNRDAIVTARDDTPHTLQALELINGSSLSHRVNQTASRLHVTLKEASRRKLIDRIHLQLLSRYPSEKERMLAQKVLGSDITQENLADWIWILIALPEFQWLH